MLTDGGVSNTDSVIKYISKNSSKTWFHAFGIGGSVSKWLIIEGAKAGRGI